MVTDEQRKTITFMKSCMDEAFEKAKGYSEGFMYAQWSDIDFTEFEVHADREEVIGLILDDICEFILQSTREKLQELNEEYWEALNA